MNYETIKRKEEIENAHNKIVKKGKGSIACDFNYMTVQNKQV